MYRQPTPGLLNVYVTGCDGCDDTHLPHLQATWIINCSEIAEIKAFLCVLYLLTLTLVYVVLNNLLKY